MKKTLYTLNLNDYAPEVVRTTYPLLKHYAKKIGAEFVVISERRFPDWPLTYEKLQVGALAVERGDEWSIFLDSDALVHPDTPDWTNFIPKDTVAHNGADFANLRWRYDDYFRRDGRNIGSCTWCVVASEWTVQDLWRPTDATLAETLDNIYPLVGERFVETDHLIDDYLLSRNIARFGLKFTTLMDLQKKLGLESMWFFWHAYNLPLADKIAAMNVVLDGETKPDGTVTKGWDLPKSLRG